MLAFFDIRQGEIKRIHYFFILLILLLSIDGVTAAYAILFGTSSFAILGLCISLYIQLLVDSRRFRNIGMSPYFALIGTVLKVWGYIMVLGAMNSAFIHNKDQFMVQDANVSLMLQAVFSHLNELNPMNQVSEILPFIALYFITLGYVVFLMIVKDVKSKGRQYTAKFDGNTDLHDFKGREE